MFFAILTSSSTEPRDFRWSPIVVRLVPIVVRYVIASSGLLSFQIFYFRPHFPNFCQNLLVAVNRFLRLINFAWVNFGKSSFRCKLVLSSAWWDTNSLTCLIKSSSVNEDDRRMGRKFAARISSRRPVSKDFIKVLWILGVHRSGLRSLILCLRTLLCYLERS
jgi:hypothetical protein